MVKRVLKGASRTRRGPAPVRDPGQGTVGSIPGQEPGLDLLAQLKPYVRQCGDERIGAWALGTRCLLDYLLVYIAEGRGRFTIAGQDYAVQPGQLFWIPPATPHAMEGFPPRMNCPYVHFDLMYRPDLSHWEFLIPGGLTDLSDFGPLLHPPCTLPLLRDLPHLIVSPTNHRVGTLIRELCAEAARAQPFAGLRLSGLMLGIIAEILRGRAGGGGDAKLPLIEQACERMSREPRVSIDALALDCGLSPSHFRLLFQRHVGLSPRAQQRRVRLRLAKELMMASPLTLSDIARRVGFASVHGLSRAFTAIEGQSPSAWRRCDRTRIRVAGRSVPYPY